RNAGDRTPPMQARSRQRSAPNDANSEFATARPPSTHATPVLRREVFCYARGVRAPVWFFATVIGCRPSATVENTMPVANLQPYQTMALRVRSTAFAAQGQAVYLQNAVSQKLGRFCRFQQVPGAPADVVLDLSITRVGRGEGGGLVTNHNLAT